MHVNLPQKLYYSIGEISKAFNVNASLIRFWETEFEELSPKKNKKGTRRYSSVDVEKLQTIHHLVKEKGYTLDGAKDQLKNLNKNFEVIKKLEKVKRAARTGKKEAQKEEAVLLGLKQGLEAGKSIRAIEFSKEDREAFVKPLQFITDKPVMYVCNVSEREYPGSNYSLI